MASSEQMEKGLKLTDDNYFAWHIKAKALLEQKDCLEAIEPGYGGEELFETLTAGERKKNARALSLILLSVSDKHIDYIGEFKTAEKAWLTLETLNQEFGLLQQIEFLEDLSTLKKGNMNMSNYISKLLDLNRKIKRCGINLGDHTLCLYLLRGLPRDNFEIFIRSMEYVENLKLDSVMSKLLVEEKRQSRMDSESIALSTRNVKNFKSDRSDNQKPNYSQCKKKSDNKVYKCYTCGEVGHISKECPVRPNYNSNVQFSSTKQHFKNARLAKSAVSTIDEQDQVEKAKAFCSVGKTSTLKRKEWFLDSCCTDHMSPSIDDFSSLDKNVSGTIRMGNGDTAFIAGKGSVVIKTPESDGGLTVTLHDALYVPDLECGLISVSKLTDKGLSAVFMDNKAVVLQSDELIFKALKKDRVYIVNTIKNISHIFESKSQNGAACKTVSNMIWHERLGHLHQDAMRKLPVLEMKDEDKLVCEVCVQGKFSKISFPKQSEHKSSALLQIIHSDLMGKFTPASLGGSHYIMTFIDDYSRFITVKCLESKSDAFSEFVNYQKLVENQLDTKIKALQSDNGTEYTRSDFKSHLESHGITHRKTVPYCPQQNGVAERSNRTLMEMVRCMLVQSGVSKKFWAEAVMAAAYIRNRCPSSAIDNRIPYELWTNKKLTKEDMSRMKVYGCKAFAKKTSSGKLDSKVEECILIGYAEDTKDGYRLWSEERQCIIIRRDVVFNESVFPFKQKKPDDVKLCIIQEDFISDMLAQSVLFDNNEVPVDELMEELANPMHNDDVPAVLVEVQNDQCVDQIVDHAEETSSQPVLRRSKRVRSVKTCSEGCCAVAGAECDYFKDKDNAENFVLSYEPKTCQEAINSKDKDKWKEAMDLEIGNMVDNDVWEIVERPKDKQVVGSKWVFKIKNDEFGNVERFKARLVAQGFKKSMGFDWESTFSPVMKRRTVRILIAVAVENDWVIDHVDVTSAYLNSPISVETYMEQPELYVEKGKGRHGYVCKLKKSIYGLPNASKDWNSCVTKVLIQLGFKQCISDPCVFVKPDLIVGLYVDDLLVIGIKENVISFKSELSSILNIRDLGSAKNLLSFQIEQHDGKVSLSQANFINKILCEFGLQDSKACTSPLPMSKTCESNNDEKVDSTMYRSAVGSILYVSNNTRPDLSYAVHKVSQNNQCPTESNWRSVKHLLRYINGTKELKLVYQKTGKPVEVYCDADWGGSGCVEERRSISGIVIFLAGAAIIWKSMKQSTIARSTVAAEYMSMAEAALELKWLRNLFTEMLQDKFIPKPTTIYADNMGAITLSKHDLLTERTKHLDLQYHICKEQVKDGFILYKYVPSSNNIADIFTKNLPGPKTKEIVKLLGLL